jgi:hypothetical protein
MRFLKVLTIVMGVFIIVGTTALLVVVARRLSGGVSAPPASLAVQLDEAPGTHIVGMTNVADRLAVQLQGGGPDRILLLDAHSGAVAGRISLRAAP